MRNFTAALIGALVIGMYAPSGGAAQFDGVWAAGGQSTQRGCGDWFVRLNIAQGQVSGVVSVGRGSQALESLVLQPDGSFTGTAAGGGVGVNMRPLSSYAVVGRLGGETI